MTWDRKAKPRWFGPMIVVKRHAGGAYQLAELDGAVSASRFAAFRVIPYYLRKNIDIPTDDFLVYPDSIVLEAMDDNATPAVPPDDDSGEDSD
jgi:hypothetical protein